jgi:adenylate kinase family enzyme
MPNSDTNHGVGAVLPGAAACDPRCPVARIHILGASGSGTTTLGRALAVECSCPHLDTDDFFWLPTDPPYQQVRARQERQQLLGKALAKSPSWVLSGSLCGWGDLFISSFDLVVFLYIPRDLRMRRLQEREVARYGQEAVQPGGSRHEAYTAFLAWAASYDEGDLTLRSRRLHEAWLQQLTCPVVRLEGGMPTAKQVDTVCRTLRARVV